MIVFCKGRFIVRNNKLKVVISDISLYYSSTTAAILAGAANSLIRYNLDELYNNRKKKEANKISINSEAGRAIFSALYKTEKPLTDYIFEQIKKGLKQDEF